MILTYLLFLLVFLSIVLNFMFRKRMMSSFKKMQTLGLPFPISATWNAELRKKIINSHAEHQDFLTDSYRLLKIYLLLFVGVILCLVVVGAFIIF